MKDLIIGSHVFFARAGDTIDGVVVSASGKPTTDPETNWLKLPTVEDWEPQVEREKVTRWAPSPGRYRRNKSVVVSSEINHAFSLQEFTDLTFAELLLGGDKPTGGVFTPGERMEVVTGWLKIQSYDQNDQLILSNDIWCELEVTPYKFERGLNPYALVVQQIYSELNVGALTNL